MQQAELYVNETLLDMPNDSLVALSFAVNSLSDLKSVQGNISNTIQLPDTALNRMALGYPNDLNFNGASVIRAKLPCRYVQNGVEVISNGNVRITGASKGKLGIVVSCGNTDFFDLLTGKLRDLDFSEYDHIWNTAAVIASRTNQDGYVYPIVNYGNLFNDSSKWGTSVSTKDMRPAVFAKTIINKIVASTGYKLVNRLTDDLNTSDFYNNLLLPFSDDKLVHPQQYIDRNQSQNLKAQKTTQQDCPDPTNNGSDYLLVFDHIVSDTLNTFTGSIFTAPQTMTVNVDITFDKIVSSSIKPAHLDGAYIELRTNAGGNIGIITRFKTAIDVNSKHNQLYSTTYTDQKLSTTNFRLNKGEQIWVNVGSLYGCYTVIYPNVKISIDRVYNDVIFGEDVQIGGALPDMTTKDFLKFISFLFCAVIQTDNVNKTVTMVPFGFIGQNMANTVDWSNKVLVDEEVYDVQIGDYSQQNEAKWKQDDTVTPSTYANGSFYLPDKNLNLYQDVYDLPFAASYDTLVLGNLNSVFINKIPDIKSGNTDQVTKTEQRLCLLVKINGTLNYREDDAIVQTVNDNIPLTYFTRGPYLTDLILNNIFNNFYSQLTTVLSDQRKLTCYLLLNEMDIQELDFFKPLYIQKYGCYFYLSKVTDFTGLKPTKVELIRLF